MKDKNKEYIDQYDRVIKLEEIKTKKILIFISIYCIRCIQLLPKLNILESIPGLYPIIFSNGDKEENKEIGELFSKKFSIISMKEEDMIRDFQIKIHPSYIIISNKQIESGNILNIEQIISKLKEI